MAHSLRLRLVLGAAIWVTVALILGGAVLRELFAEHVEGQMISRLEFDLDQLTASIEMAEDDTPQVLRDLSDPLFQRPFSGLYWQVQTLEGTVLLRSRSLWDEQMQIDLASVDTGGAVHTHVARGPGDQQVLAVERAVTYPDAKAPLVLIVGRDETILQTLTGAFTRTLVVSLGVLALGIIGAAWAQVAYGLVPLNRLRKALAAVRKKGGQRLAGDYPSEVTPLVEDLNEMIIHNARMVDAARDSAGNLAHALKTPLAIVANQAEALAAAGQGDAAALLFQQVDSMRRHADHYLARARAQAAGEARGARTPVMPSVERLARVMERLHNAAVEVVDAGPPDFRGDQQTLEEILGNLMENACKWAGQRVRITADGANDGLVVLVVEDDGPGIPDDRLQDVLRRGRRLDESKPGSGLGLNIVDDLTRATGGGLVLDRSPDLGGLRVTVSLPVAGN